VHGQELYDGVTGAWRPRNHTLTKQHATAFPQNELQMAALYAWLYCFAIRPDYPEISVADPDPNLDPHGFLGLLDPDPDPLVRGIDPDPDPSIIKQILYSKKNLDFYCFVTSF
jgi:hypothetical protein